MSKLLKTSAAAATMVVFMLTGADAADLSTYVPPPPPEPAWLWTGPYAGLHLGYGWSELESQLAFENFLASETAASEFFPYDGNGIVEGILAGANVQWGRLLFGAEGDFSLTDSKTRATFEEITGSSPSGDNSFSFSSAPPLQDFTTEIKWLATLRARIGFAWDRLLFYGTGGVAFARVDSSYSFPAF